jgi:hypothetical protein
MNKIKSEQIQRKYRRVSALFNIVFCYSARKRHSGCRSITDKDACLLGCYVMLHGNYLPTFSEEHVAFVLSVKQTKKSFLKLSLSKKSLLRLSLSKKNLLRLSLSKKSLLRLSLSKKFLVVMFVLANLRTSVTVYQSTRANIPGQ